LNPITQIADFRSTTSRDILRHLVLDGLSVWQRGVDCVTARRPSGVRILLLHHVFDDEVSRFESLLTRLAKEYRFVSYSEAICQAQQIETDEPLLAFSFDDGQKNCLNAAKVLEKFDATACFFVCPSIVGQRSPVVIKDFCRNRLWHPPVDFMDWCDIERLLAHGHEIGGHTMTHINLGECSHDQAQSEIHDCHAALVARVGVPEHFAWPYGRLDDITPAAAKEIFAAGFRSCASGERGSHAVVSSETSQTSVTGESVTSASWYVRRESILASWPKRHVRYFLDRSLRHSVRLDTQGSGFSLETRAA